MPFQCPQRCDAISRKAVPLQRPPEAKLGNAMPLQRHSEAKLRKAMPLQRHSEAKLIKARPLLQGHSEAELSKARPLLQQFPLTTGRRSRANLHRESRREAGGTWRGRKLIYSPLCTVGGINSFLPFGRHGGGGAHGTAMRRCGDAAMRRCCGRSATAAVCGMAAWGGRASVRRRIGGVLAARRCCGTTVAAA